MNTALHRRLPESHEPPRPRLFIVPSWKTRECLQVEEKRQFVSQRDRLRPDLLAFLTPATAEQYERSGVRLFLTPDGQGGYGLRGEELVSVFSLCKSQPGSELVRDAIARGARVLDCFDANGVLTKFYLKLGFREVSREPWNDAFAPPGWDYHRFGRPDLVQMSLD